LVSSLSPSKEIANPGPAKVEERREKPIDDAMTKLQRLVEELLEPPDDGTPRVFRPPLPTTRCPRGDDDCQSLLFGSLSRSLKAHFLWPILHHSSPHYYLDTTTLLRHLKGLKVQSQCAKLPGPLLGSATHGVIETIADIVAALQGSHVGLDLTDFQGGSSMEEHAEF